MMQVASIRRRRTLVRGEPLNPDSYVATWMKEHHGDLSTRAILPWRCTLEHRAPVVVAMWCIPPLLTQDDTGATVYATERGTNLVVYVVEKHGAKYNLDMVLGVMHPNVAFWWANGRFGTTVAEYVRALEHVHNSDPRLYGQLAPKHAQVIIQSKGEANAGALLPEHSLALCCRILIRPLKAECEPHFARRQWTGLIEQLQSLIFILQLMNQAISMALKGSVCLLVGVHLERMLSMPLEMVPENAPPLLLDLLKQLQYFLGKKFCERYQTVMRSVAKEAVGCMAVVLEDSRFRCKPFPPRNEALIQWLLQWQPNIGAPLQWLVQGDATQAEQQVVLDDLLCHLAVHAVPQDKHHRWVEDIPWDRVVHIALASCPSRSSKAKSHLADLSQLLDINLQAM